MALYTCAGCEDLWNAPQAPGPITAPAPPSSTQVVVGPSGENVIQITQHIPWAWIILGLLVGYSLKRRRTEVAHGQ